MSPSVLIPTLLLAVLTACSPAEDVQQSDSAPQESGDADTASDGGADEGTGGADSGAADEAAVAWYPEVQAIVQESCLSCHIEGGVAPFSLETYGQAAPLAAALADSVESGAMPPWMPDPDCREFQDERLLSPEAIASVRAWADAGAPEGDPSLDRPYAPVVYELEDYTAAQKAPGFTPDDSYQDQYRCFILDEFDLSETAYLTGSQVVPDTSAVHHVLVYTYPDSARADMEARDAADEGEGFDCVGGASGAVGEGGISFSDLLTGAAEVETDFGFPNQIGAWVPGSKPNLLEEGRAIRVPAGSFVLMQIHYSALGGAFEPDETELRLRFTDETPEELVSTTALIVYDLDIQAGDASESFTWEYPYYGREPITLRSLTGHMHLLGSAISASAVSDGGEESCLLDIPEWDFDWQEAYRTPEDQPAVIASGDRVSLTCTYDNSAANQPVVDGVQQEPRDVSWGEGTLDEMCLLYMGRVEPWAPEADPEAAACADSADCMSRCGEGASLDCLLQCEEASVDCQICGLGATAGCGAACAAYLAADTDCVRECFLSTFLLGGNLGQCLANECPETYDSYVQCADGQLAGGECDQALSDCGLSL